MLIDKPIAILYTLAFLAPGFVMTAIGGLLAPQRKVESSTLLLRLLTTSMINYAVWSPLIAWMMLGSFFAQNLAAMCIALAWITLVGPAALGVLWGVASQRNWMGRLFAKLKLTSIHPVPVSWDYVFGDREGHEFVIVTLKDGTKKAGRFGPKSFASSYPDGNDLFLEAVFEIGEDGGWKEHPTVAGILIASGEIRTVEFLRPTDPLEEENNNGKEDIEACDRRPSTALPERGIEGASTESERERQRA